MVEYRRVYPPPTHPLDADAPRTSAHLKLPDSVQRIGQGSHADVYQAHLTLDGRFRLVTHQPTSETVEPATVRVATKIPSGNDDDLAMLEHEARMYNAFPDHLSEDWSGFNAITNAVTYELDSDGRVPATAIVPKFYGYFIPSEQPAEELSRARPILLMEECGHPIDPKDLTTEQRLICFAFPHRLSHEGFIQNSFYTRNILVQPGPLTHPPNQRSMETPSFRVVDFGRCQWWCDLLPQSPSEGDGDRAAAQVEAAARRKRKKAIWKEWFRSEREMAKDTIFGKLRKYIHGNNTWCDGRLEERAYRIQAREWLFKPCDPHHHWRQYS